MRPLSGASPARRSVVRGRRDMAKGQRVEVIEIPTEQPSYVRGRQADRLATLHRWTGAWHGAVVALTRSTAIAAPTALAGRAPSMVGRGGATFRRMIEVPGCRLALVLGAWWRQAEHDDGYLRLDVPCPVGDAWSLSGAFRRTLISRWLPVELLLSPYRGRWTMLELMLRLGDPPEPGLLPGGPPFARLVCRRDPRPGGARREMAGRRIDGRHRRLGRCGRCREVELGTSRSC